MEIAPKTLRKPFCDDLEQGMAEANVKIAQRLFNMATTGGSVAAAIFWMKARAGWREKHEITVSTDPLERLSDTELEQMISALRDQIAEHKASVTDGADTGAHDDLSVSIGRRLNLIEAD